MDCHYIRYMSGYPLCWESDRKVNFFGTFFMVQQITCRDCLSIMATWHPQPRESSYQH